MILKLSKGSWKPRGDSRCAGRRRAGFDSGGTTTKRGEKAFCKGRQILHHSLILIGENKDVKLSAMGKE